MPRKIDYEARREAFLKAAGRLIRRDGFAGLTVRAVAREAGFTTGALVHYVDSMDDLLVDAFEFAGRGLRARMDEAETGPDPLVALREVLYLVLPNSEGQLGHWMYWLGFRERSVQSAAVRKITYMRYAGWLKRTQRVIRRAKAAGDIARDVDVPVAARAAVALIDGLAAQVLRSSRGPSAREQRALVDDWIRLWPRPTRTIARPRLSRAGTPA